MSSDSLEYKRKVWQFLEEIKSGQTYTVEKICSPETREDFIAAIKEYMESLPWQGFVTFNRDFSKFYRTEPVPFNER